MKKGFLGRFAFVYFAILGSYETMGVRVTVVIDDTNLEKLRGIQAKMIKTSTKSVSFSHVLNQVVGEGLKKFKP